MVKKLMMLSVLTIAGCGGDGGKVSISGSVEMDGKPLGEATVGFLSEGGSSMASAATGPDGKFFAKVAPGMNKVTVSKVDQTAAPPAPMKEEDTLSPVDSELAKMRAAPKPKDAVPERFGDPNKSGLRYEIRKGMDPVDISITSK